MSAHNVRGFSLIELMIAVAIIGIIAAVALPSYTSHVEKTRRTTAQADLMELSQWMERRYSNGFDYRGAGSPPATPTLPFTQSPQNGTAFYNITLDSVTRDKFELHAAPTGAQSGDSCGTLTLNEQGNRGADAADCW